ncbi:U3 small nucleolar RNA-associated protein 14 homolog A-like [Tubulanus polymorphus]|uniref:U3 small nucleolar RNA-associated protein 14 homolog A-like n=1 Tax=Tubulanus polymorphus TaxID=672921 RepID=UPI003DA49525
MIDNEDDDYISAPSDAEPELDDEFKHAKLLDAISSLDGKKRATKFLRKEATDQVSEFNITSSNDVSGKVNVTDLLSKINTKTKNNKKLKEKLKKCVRDPTDKVLPTPLPTYQQEKIRRSVAYETTTTEVSKWDSVVQKNRKADQLQFPLGGSELHVINQQPTNKFVQRFQAQTPLEKEIAALLGTSSHIIPTDHTLTKAEERALKAMSLEEARMRRAELQKYRALLSYKEAKARRQNKIKSKSYHKVLRKEKQKNELNSMEELKRIDPESFNEKIRQIERIRIQERMSLKHKGGSKFSRQQKIHAKYDKEAQQSVQDMHQKHQQLTQKVAAIESSESEDDDEKNDKTEETNTDQRNQYNPWIGSNIDVKNPWMNTVKIKKVSDYSRPAEIRNTEIIEDILHSASEDEQEVEQQQQQQQQQPDKRQTVETDIEKLDSVKPAKKRKSIDQKNKEEPEVKKSKTNGEKKPVKQQQQKQSNNSTKKNKIKKSIRNKLKETDDIDEMFDVLDNLGEQAAEINKEKRKSRQVKRKERIPAMRKNDEERHREYLDVDETEEKETEESTTHRRTLEDLDLDNWSDNEELTLSNVARVLESEKNPKPSQQESTTIHTTEEAKIDPKQILTMKTYLRGNSDGKFVSDDEEEAEENGEEEKQKMTIAEAFADDDILDEFESEKREEEDADKPKDIDLSLPGWGVWGGEGVRPVSNRRKNRFVIKAAPTAPRKDRNLGNVIICERKDKTIQKHQVSSLPHPFSSVSQYESTIQAPLGNTWNTATSFKQLTKPKVVTRLGTIIEPMDQSQKLTDARKTAGDLPETSKPSQQQQTVHKNTVKMPLKSNKFKNRFRNKR